MSPQLSGDFLMAWDSGKSDLLHEKCSQRHFDYEKSLETNGKNVSEQTFMNMIIYGVIVSIII